jgi:hypothetical protein
MGQLLRIFYRISNKKFQLIREVVLEEEELVIIDPTTVAQNQRVDVISGALIAAVNGLDYFKSGESANTLLFRTFIHII